MTITLQDMPSSPKGKEKSTSTSVSGIPSKSFKSMEMDEESAMPSELPWVEKYRPKQFADIVHHRDIISTCNHHYYHHHFN